MLVSKNSFVIIIIYYYYIYLVKIITLGYIVFQQEVKVRNIFFRCPHVILRCVLPRCTQKHTVQNCYRIWIIDVGDLNIEELLFQMSSLEFLLSFKFPPQGGVRMYTRTRRVRKYTRTDPTLNCLHSPTNIHNLASIYHINPNICTHTQLLTYCPAVISFILSFHISHKIFT